MRISFDHCTVDLEAAEVQWPERTEPLTAIEAKLLGHLFARAGEVVTRSELLTEVWEYHPASQTHTVGVIVRRVRKKLEVEPAQPLILRTVRGKGWTVALPTATPEATTNLVPARDRFFGREAVMARLDARFVTVTGPPGVGKSRLALEHGWREARRGRLREVWWVRVDRAETTEGIVARVADVLGVVLAKEGQWVERVGRALAGRGPVLLVMDEAEALAAEVGAVVDAWLDMAPRLRIVVTSRQRLKVSGERVVRLEPLSTDDGVALFADRAAARGAPLDDEEGITRLVEHLEGLPLALELAAARAGLRDARALLEEVRAHGSEPLDAAVRWSIGLLDPWERRALAQTSVFDGGFDLEAARAVLDPGSAHTAEGALGALVDWSLVRRLPPLRPGMPVRFDTLASIAGPAEALGVEPDAVARHAEHYASYGTDAFQQSLHRHGGIERRARLHLERGNLARAARRGPDAAAARCAQALASLTNVVGPVTEGVDALTAVLARPTLPEAHRYRALVVLSRALLRAGRSTEANARFAESGSLAATEPSALWDAWHAHVAFAIARRVGSDDVIGIGEHALRAAAATGDPKELSVAEMNLANALMDGGRVEEGIALQAQALRHATEAGDQRGQAYARALAATWALQRAEPGALDALVAARAEAEAAGDRYTLGWTATSLISALRWAERFDEAIEAGESAIQLHADLGDAALEAVCRGNLASVFLDLGALDEALELFDQAIDGARGVKWSAAEAAFRCGRSEVLARSGRDGLPDVLAAIGALETGGSKIHLAEAWVQRGSVALWAGDRQGAVAALARARDIAGTDVPIGLRRATTQLEDRLRASE